jgi:hypothetical protein
LFYGGLIQLLEFTFAVCDGLAQDHTTMPKNQSFLLLLPKQLLFFFGHDAHNEMITIEQTEEGVRLKEQFRCFII